MNLTALRKTLDHRGPFASVHLDASHDTEDAAKVTELRWRAVREELTERDTPDPTLGALEDALDRAPPAGRAGRLLVAAGDAVLVDEYLPAPPAQPVVRVSALPYLLPLADWSRRDVPYVVVSVDRTGAEVRAVRADGSTHTEDVEGREHPVHKVRGAGMAHRNVQRHTEETVKHNIGEVAEEVARQVRNTDAQLLALAGDPEARTRLREALPAECREIVAEIEHSRVADPTHDTVERDVADLLAEQRRVEQDRVLERFRAGGGHGLAVQGLAATTAALREANVEVLLVDARAVGDATVWAGTDPTMVATDRADLHRIGVSERLDARADEALPAAALASGAEIVAATGDEPALELAGGVGAILRHT
ncbi:MAG TPA: Vms1/Ankzf1 family peptidyl-tRNA hydrolase [Actinophytocola sp.]|nr:Vms1/Ankzf1 family peptidyl-tRNA hydrolase [Actinophytocola sp.]